MNFKHLIVFCLMTVIAIIAGCSGSGRNLGGGGRYCHIRSFEGFEQKADGSEIVSKFVKAENKGTPEDVLTAANLPPGTYELNIADYMYLRKVDPNNRRRWIMTQVREDVDAAAMERKKNETGQESENIYRSFRYCAGGYRKGDKTYEASMNGITSMTVDASGKIEFETTSWGYRFDGEKDRIESLWLEKADDGSEKPAWSKPDDHTKYSAPKDVFGENLSVLSLRKLPNKDQEFYQIYSRQDLDDGTTFQFLRVTLKRIPPPEQPAEETTEEEASETDPKPEDEAPTESDQTL